MALAICTQCTYLQIFWLAKIRTTPISTTGSSVAYGAVWRRLGFALLGFPCLINKEAVLVICLRFFFCCVIKCSNKSNFKEKWFIVDTSSTHSPSRQESQGQELGAAGHTTSVVRREKWMSPDSQFLFPIDTVQDLCQEWYYPLRTVRSSQLSIVMIIPHSYVRRPISLGDSRSCQVDKANQCVIIVFFGFEPASCNLCCVLPSSLSGWWSWRWWKFKTFMADTYTASVIMAAVALVFMIPDPVVIQGLLNKSLGENCLPINTFLKAEWQLRCRER